LTISFDFRSQDAPTNFICRVQTQIKISEDDKISKKTTC
jgi:hypothetical protein